MIAQGAEARLEKIGTSVIKERFSKKYRLPIIDEKLRKSRTRREAKLLETMKVAQIPAPELISMCDSSMKIEMSFVDGKKVRDVLDKSLAKEIGKLVGSLHQMDVIHADLTTSNMILKDDKIHIIDFGLSFVSPKLEDKAVDLRVMERALASSHHLIYNDCWPLILEGYKEMYGDAESVLTRLDEVQKRGRNKRKPNA
jgi:Kae1-associated kinase Bud32